MTVEIADIYELSPMQKAMLFHALHTPGSGTSFNQFSCRISGELALGEFRDAWRHLVDRHPVLRTSFHWEGLDKPVQVVHHGVDLPWSSSDWRSLTANTQRELWRDHLARDVEEGFRFDQAPLMRCHIASIDDREYLFNWSHHHLLMDGWCLSLVLAEVLSIYQKLRASLPLSAAPVRPYRDYIEWLQRQDTDRAKQYWTRYLKDFRSATPMPGSARQYESWSAAVAQIETELSEELSSRLREFAAQQQITMSTVVHGAWSILLGRYSEATDIVFGATVSGRPAELAGIETMLGLFINTLPVRVRVATRLPVAPWLKMIQARQAARSQFEYTPLADIQRWSEIRRGTPLFESNVVFMNYPLDQSLAGRADGLEIGDVAIYDRADIPLELQVTPAVRWKLELAYDPHRFERVLMGRVLDQITLLLERFVEAPGGLLGQLSLVGEAERRRLLTEFNDTDVAFDPWWTVVDRLEALAQAQPDRLVLEDQDGAVSLYQLNRRANRLARWLLQQADLGPDDRVAIVLPRSVPLIEAILAVWKCGAAYVPVDPTDPPARIAAIIEQSQPRLVLTETDLAGAARAGDAGNLGRRIDSASLAYVMFTSGSTGVPKGVMIEHAGMLNHLLAKIEDLPLGPESVVAQNASHCCDISVWQFFSAPLAGGRTVILSDELVMDPLRFLAAVAARGVNVLEVVPSYLAVLLLEHPANALRGLDRLLVTGEAASRALIERWFACCPQVPVINAYGPTEASDDITHHHMERTPEGPVIPVGKPIRNLQIYVLDDALNLCPPGVPGEICVGGVGVGRGYLNDPARTQAAFLPDPFRPGTNRRMYRTGDIGSFAPDGTILLSGRKDHQVKIHGQRIELGEIENALNEIPEISHAVVRLVTQPSGSPSLVAYFIPSDQRGESEALRQALARRLPAYMLPHAFLPLERFPLTSNGKIDRKALAQEPLAWTESAPQSAGRYVPARNRKEGRLLQIWRELLRQREIGVTDNYFDFCGVSILAVRLMARIEREFGRRLAIAQLFQHPTIEKLAEALRFETVSAPADGMVEIRPGGTAAPLFLVPGAGGNVLYFHALARRLRATRSIYGLEAPGLNGSTDSLSRVEDIAARNLGLVRRVFGTGPYYLAGHSFGGNVALEMSRQLRHAGAEVALLAIFDTAAPHAGGEHYWRDWDDTQWLLAITHEIGIFLGAELDISREELESLDAEAQLTWIIEKLRNRGPWFAEAEVASLRGYLNVYKSNFRATYEPPANILFDRIVLFKTAESRPEDYAPSPETAALRQDPAWGWGRFSSRGVEVVDVPGDHLTMLLEPHVSALAANLDRCLEEATDA